MKIKNDASGHGNMSKFFVAKTIIKKQIL